MLRALYLLACCVLAARAQVVFDISLASPLPAPAVSVVPGNMASFSHETPFATQMLLSNLSSGTVRQSYVTLLRYLQSVGGGAGANLRVGANYGDVSEWSPGGAALLANNTYRITQTDLVALSQALPLFNGSCVVGLNARSNMPERAVAHAVAAVAALGWDLLESFEIGNEPDMYYQNGMRPASYQASDYSADFARYTAALIAAGVPAGRVQAPGTVAPATTTGSSWNSSWLSSFVSSFSALGRLHAVATHYYPLSVCGYYPNRPVPTPTLLLDETAQRTAIARLAPAIAAAHAAGLPFHIAEGAGVCCAGANGTADAMPIALWSVDALFSMAAAGVSRFNFHGGPYGGPIGDNAAVRYQVIGINPLRYSLTPQVTPLWYGIVAFTAATGRNARLVRTVNASAPGRAKCWAVVDETGQARVTLLNKDVNASASLAVRLRVAAGGNLTGAATVQALLPGAGGLASKTGLTWAGQTWDGSLDGSIQGTRSIQSVAPTSPGVYDITLPPFAVLVVTLPCVAPPSPPSPPSPPPQVPSPASSALRAMTWGRGITAALVFMHCTGL